MAGDSAYRLFLRDARKSTRTFFTRMKIGGAGKAKLLTLIWSELPIATKEKYESRWVAAKKNEATKDRVRRQKRNTIANAKSKNRLSRCTTPWVAAVNTARKILGSKESLPRKGTALYAKAKEILAQ